MIRVAIVDDQALFRAGIGMLLSSQSDLEFAGEASDGSEALAMVRATAPDVVLMDIRMPGMDGVTATAHLIEELPEPPRVIVLTTFDLDEAAARALRAGASGFLLKDADPEFLLAAIRTVHAGTAVLAPSATTELLERFAGRGPVDRGVLDDLTDRERQIFGHAARGMSNAEIASVEFVSEATVKTHISRILAKLGLRDRVQLVVFAYERGLV